MYLRFIKVRPLIKSTAFFKRRSVEIACAHPNLNLQFRGCLRPLWPLMSHIGSFTLKYHISIAFVHLRLFRGCFVIGWILLHKQEFCSLSFVLNSPLRLNTLYWGRNNRHLCSYKVNSNFDLFEATQINSTLKSISWNLVNF